MPVWDPQDKGRFHLAGSEGTCARKYEMLGSPLFHLPSVCEDPSVFALSWESELLSEEA